ILGLRSWLIPTPALVPIVRLHWWKVFGSSRLAFGPRALAPAVLRFREAYASRINGTLTGALKIASRPAGPAITGRLRSTLWLAGARTACPSRGTTSSPRRDGPALLSVGA